METYWGNGGIVPRILDLGTTKSEWSASRAGRFTPRERVPDTRWTGGWVDPRAGLEAVVRTSPSSRREWNPRTPCQPKVLQTLRLKHYTVIMCSELVSNLWFQCKRHRCWGTVIQASCSSTNTSPYFNGILTFSFYYNLVLKLLLQRAQYL
jgi:hypothetical protein